MQSEKSDLRDDARGVYVSAKGRFSGTIIELEGDRVVKLDQEDWALIETTHVCDLLEKASGFEGFEEVSCEN
jgi:hypothetical protein